MRVQNLFEEQHDFDQDLQEVVNTEEKIVAQIEISYRALSEAADGTEFPWSNKWEN